MASNVSVRKSRGGLKWNKQPVEQEVQKKVSKNLPATKRKANKQPTCYSEQLNLEEKRKCQTIYQRLSQLLKELAKRLTRRRGKT